MEAQSNNHQVVGTGAADFTLRRVSLNRVLLLPKTDAALVWAYEHAPNSAALAGAVVLDSARTLIALEALSEAGLVVDSETGDGGGGL